MTKKKQLREAAIEAHAAFIRHDAHCSQCSRTARYGPAWTAYMCPVGLNLYHADQTASKAEGKEG